MKHTNGLELNAVGQSGKLAAAELFSAASQNAVHQHKHAGIRQ